MTDCLANTGSSIFMYVAYGLLVLIFSLVLLRKLRNNHFGRITFVAVALIGATVFLAASPLSTKAASDCVAAVIASSSDATTGPQGQPQSINVTTNDRPSSGANFVLNSLTLRLLETSPAGSTISSDNKTVTVPGEGVYVASGDGVIQFTPEPAFAGTAHGVGYSISDTFNQTTSNIYVPVVVAAVSTTCVDTASETRILNDSTIAYVYGVTEYTIDSFSTNASSDLPAIDPNDIDIDASTAGVQKTIVGSNGLWSASYNPSTDQLILTVYDNTAFYNSIDNNALFTYSVAPKPNCSQPAGGNIYVSIVN